MSHIYIYAYMFICVYVSHSVTMKEIQQLIKCRAACAGACVVLNCWRLHVNFIVTTSFTNNCCCSFFIFNETLLQRQYISHLCIFCWHILTHRLSSLRTHFAIASLCLFMKMEISFHCYSASHYASQFVMQAEIHGRLSSSFSSLVIGLSAFLHNLLVFLRSFF